MKNQIFREVSRKKRHRGGNCLKKGGWTFWRFKVGTCCFHSTSHVLKIVNPIEYKIVEMRNLMCFLLLLSFHDWGKIWNWGVLTSSTVSLLAIKLDNSSCFLKFSVPLLTKSECLAIGSAFSFWCNELYWSCPLALGIQVFTFRITVALPLSVVVITRLLHFEKIFVAVLSVSVKLSLGNLFLSENLSTTFLLTASINVSLVWWFSFLFMFPVGFTFDISFFVSLVSCFCSFLFNLLVETL